MKRYNNFQSENQDQFAGYEAGLHTGTGKTFDAVADWIEEDVREGRFSPQNYVETLRNAANEPFNPVSPEYESETVGMELKWSHISSTLDPDNFPKEFWNVLEDPPCSSCGERLTEKDVLWRHEVNPVTKEDEYFCKECHSVTMAIRREENGYELEHRSR